ncbi:MAG: hypothetical protein ABL878_16025 [Burkholderiales bacterium]
MNSKAILLIVLGLLMGPGYLAYCEYWSGGEAETYVLSERAERWKLPDGAILRFRSGMGYKPQTVNLDPALNRYRILLTFEPASSGDGPQANQYQFSVLEGEATVVTRNLRIGGDGTLAARIDSVEVPYAGRYVLLLEEVGRPALEISRVKLEIRSRVLVPVMWLAWCGMVLMVVGVGLVVRVLVLRGANTAGPGHS